MRHQVFETRIGLLRSAESDILPHRPEALPVHVLVNAARERVLAGSPDVALEIDAGEILGPVGRRDRKAGVCSQLFHPSPPSPLGRSARRNAFTISGNGVPIGKTSCTPSRFRGSTSRGGMVPPTTTAMSAASCALSPSS